MTGHDRPGARWAPRAPLAALLALVALLGLVGVPAAAALPDPLIDAPPASWPAPPEVSAPVFLLVDVATGQTLAARDPDTPRPVASTVKILTALTVLDHLDPDDEVVVGDEVRDVPGASGALLPGDRRTVEELLAILMVRSGNDVAEALAVATSGDRDAFLAQMSATAARLGLRPRLFTSPSGLDDGQLLSARELAVIGAAALAHPDLRPLLALPELADPRAGTQPNRNELVGSYPGATGIKTGFTEAAGNILVASARRGERELIAVVLGAGDDPARFMDAAALLDHGFDAFEPAEVAATHHLAVAGGALTLTAGPAALVVPRGAEVALRLPLPVWPPEQDVSAPLEVDGEVVAQLTAAVAGTIPAPREGDAAVGRVLADGAYAALRAAVSQARLPEPARR